MQRSFKETKFSRIEFELNVLAISRLMLTTKLYARNSSSFLFRNLVLTIFIIKNAHSLVATKKNERMKSSIINLKFG